LLVINLFTPTGIDAPLISLLFFSLFIGLTGLFCLAGFIFRAKRYKNPAPLQFLKISFRQGSLLAVLLAGTLFLRTYKVFWWGSGMILLMLVLAAEFYALRKQG